MVICISKCGYHVFCTYYLNFVDEKNNGALQVFLKVDVLLIHHVECICQHSVELDHHLIAE